MSDVTLIDAKIIKSPFNKNNVVIAKNNVLKRFLFLGSVD